MNAPYLCYLSGPIAGLSYQTSAPWREYTTQAFPPHISGVSPMRGQRYLDIPGREFGNEALQEFPLSTDRAIKTRNLFDTLRADALLVNLLGAERVSIGTVMEIAWAYDHNIPVIVAMEIEGNPHDHPMVRDCLSVRVASLDEAIEAVVAIVSPHEKYIWTRLDMVHMLQEEGKLDLHSERNKEGLNGTLGKHVRSTNPNPRPQ
jgi:hypothetical protein